MNGIEQIEFDNSSAELQLYLDDSLEYERLITLLEQENNLLQHLHMLTHIASTGFNTRKIRKVSDIVDAQYACLLSKTRQKGDL